ncbi:hypothetical protein BC828DRAFT_379044 [Blastocladiella britannica]|nr:hypothetical protein BC828DRAFT_379044 [Blastocladiella britannica]
MDGDPAFWPTEDEVQALVDLFPLADPAYLAHALTHYNPGPPGSCESSPMHQQHVAAGDDRTARVAHKIIELNHGYLPTLSPTVSWSPPPASASSASAPTTPPAAPRRQSWLAGVFSGNNGPAPAPSNKGRHKPPQRYPPSHWVAAAHTSAESRNQSLAVLADLFPAVDVSYLKARIDAAAVNTVAVVADELLDRSVPATGGRRRRITTNAKVTAAVPRRPRWGVVGAAEWYRSPAYIRGARTRLYNSFPHLWKSSIKAYFAEHNFSFPATYLALSTLPAPSGPSTPIGAFFSTLFSRSPQADPAMYDPALLRDLDRLELVLRARQVHGDAAMARQVALREAEDVGDTVECACCMDDVGWDDAVACTGGIATSGDDGEAPHVVCAACIRRTVHEALYGQAAAAISEKGIQCLAPGIGCTGGYADLDVARALAFTTGPEGGTAHASVSEGVDDVDDPNAVDDGEEATNDTDDPLMGRDFVRYAAARGKAAAIAAGLPIASCAFCGYSVVPPRPIATGGPAVVALVNDMAENGAAYAVLARLVAALVLAAADGIAAVCGTTRARLAWWLWISPASLLLGIEPPPVPVLPVHVANGNNNQRWLGVHARPAPWMRLMLALLEIDLVLRVVGAPPFAAVVVHAMLMARAVLILAYGGVGVAPAPPPQQRRRQAQQQAARRHRRRRGGEDGDMPAWKEWVAVALGLRPPLPPHAQQRRQRIRQAGMTPGEFQASEDDESSDDESSGDEDDVDLGRPGATGGQEEPRPVRRRGRRHDMPSTAPVSRCANPRCARATCSGCGGEWQPMHRCHDDGDVSVEQFVELAMSRAVKRVCPDCHLPFTKSDGCNLMTCARCTYVMCYVCRRGIGDERYKHFCDHVRWTKGTPCDKCTRCELYVAEDEMAVRRAAGRRALDRWMMEHPGIGGGGGGGGLDKVRLAAVTKLIDG